MTGGGGRWLQLAISEKSVRGRCEVGAWAWSWGKELPLRAGVAKWAKRKEEGREPRESEMTHWNGREGAREEAQRKPPKTGKEERT